MRDFFIRSLETLIGVIVVVLAIGVAVAAIATMMGNGMAGGPHMGNRVLAGLLVLVIGAIYVLFIGGFMYLGLGIYQNTKRSAEALEKLVDR